MFYVELVQRAKRITQDELSRRTGIDQSTISKIFRGRINPTSNELERLAAGLDCAGAAARLMDVVDPLVVLQPVELAAKATDR